MRNERRLILQETPLLDRSLAFPSKVSCTSIDAERGDCQCCRRLVIDPNEAKYLNYWDALVALLVVIVALLEPFEISFLDLRLDGLFWFNRFVDVVFLLDMGLQFFISFPDNAEPHKVIRNPKRIAKHYLSTWFCVDFCSVLPFDSYTLLMARGRSQPLLTDLRGLREIKVVRLLRIVRMLRLARVKRLAQRWEASLGLSYTVLGLVKFFALGVVTCHWMACLWGGVALHSCGTPPTLVCESETCACWITSLRCGKPLSHSSTYHGVWHVYLLSLYWSIVTLTGVGYGDITPQTMAEYVLATLCASITASIWAYVIGSVCGIVSTMEPHEEAHRRTMDELNNLFIDTHVPHNLRKIFRRYFIEHREMSRQRAEADIVEQMSPKLRGQLSHCMHQQWISKVWYLKTSRTEAMLFLAERIVSALYVPDEDIVAPRTLCIIRRGICSVLGKWVVSGQYWGEDMLLSNAALRQVDSARSLTFLSLLQLTVGSIKEMLVAFPSEISAMRWAQIRIGIRRGVAKIANVARELGNTADVLQRLSTPAERAEFIVHILQDQREEARHREAVVYKTLTNLFDDST